LEVLRLLLLKMTLPLRVSIEAVVAVEQQVTMVMVALEAHLVPAPANPEAAEAVAEAVP
jgi:hypothetical protein